LCISAMCFAKISLTISCRVPFLDGYCSTVQGLLDWFEVDLGFTELLLIQIDLCVMCVLQKKSLPICCRVPGMCVRVSRYVLNGATRCVTVPCVYPISCAKPLSFACNVRKSEEVSEVCLLWVYQLSSSVLCVYQPSFSNVLSCPCSVCRST